MEAESIVQIDDITELLDNIVTGNIIKPIPRKFEPKLKFIIARKWNSWYPSYFDTNGGCYAFITRDSKEDIKDNSGVIVIDPGFRFSDILRKNYKIEPHDIRKIIVSHYHPDHTMGLFELLTLTNETKYPCSYYLNKTTYEAFKTFQGKHNKIIELNNNQVIKLAQYVPRYPPREGIFSDVVTKRKDHIESIYLKALKTFHVEIGNRHNSLGFIFNIINTYEGGREEQELVLLGDTDGNESYIDTYLEYLKNAKVAVLHIGSFSCKGYGEGNKHLYKTGMLDILNCINCVAKGVVRREGRINHCIERQIISYDSGESRVNPGPNESNCIYRSNNYFKNLELVIISELGLEMAPIPELLESFKNLNWFADLFPFFLLVKICDQGKINSQCEVFSTKTMQYINNLVNKSKNGLNIEDSLYLYNNAILLGIHCYFRTLRNLRQTRTADPLREKVWTYFDEFLLFLEDVEESMGDADISNLNDYINCVETAINYCIVRLPLNRAIRIDQNFLGIFESQLSTYLCQILITTNIKSIKTNYNNSKLLSDLDIFSNFIFNSRKEITKKTKFDPDRYTDILNNWTTNLSELSIVLSSMSLINKDTEIKLKETAKTEGLTKFDPFVRYMAYKINKGFVDHKKIMKSLPKHKGDERCSGLINFLKNYNINERGIKYFVSDMGMEIDLSQGLQVRGSSKKEWIPLASSKQVIKRGSYSLKNIRLK